jgi:predicted dithiol-disulfide oxidoreductase (DUF899 family)
MEPGMTQSGPSGIQGHQVVSHEEWLAARRAFLATEKEFTRLRDELSRQRRALPWERVEKPYLFDGPRGPRTLPELFAGRSQLAVYHFMFAPEWDEGCPHCSFWADNFDGIGEHLAQRDVTFVAISRAPLAKLEAFKARMGWRFDWLSSLRSDFNYDFQVSFRPEDLARKAVTYNYETTADDHTDREGASVFYRDASGGVFHAYSTYARGIDILNGAYH